MQNKAIRNFVPEFRAKISSSPDVKWRNGAENDKIEVKIRVRQTVSRFQSGMIRNEHVLKERITRILFDSEYIEL